MQPLNLHPKRESPNQESKGLKASSHYFGIKTYKKTKINADSTLFTHAVPPLATQLCKPKHFAPSSRIQRFCAVRSPNPYREFKAYQKLKNYVILGIGANCGECLVTFWKLVFRLKTKNAIISFSSIFKNPAFGYTAQADFYNAILWVETKLGYVEFWSLCAYLERIFGRNRKRPFKNAPRSLDIDIIGFKNKTLRLEHLQIPHISWSFRESVKIPLLERKI
ncbi:2-amino-4-hydroxy-6-hydroxymethyldihydropteridine diphosphokinase [Helicobacter sp. MIT 05-5294]|uniref:2-amino-4-hydroxy-6- hydroxymethyldihydropteridine diphosphokinase n=1 Tax=Helicobacter sp. MIT 05-5294 TaxID=1548150 RepID=UPI000A911C86|nr:2-amino-4-hydroxy-6-hydroxymethyldihydropteridine diphosphokinase [Helicobacter sp. MIT 05-5294]TLD89143.1 2-amino-4-hydroxy-6-hydroxymethyldihydropteridine diphosphokinase [Helicobacter sp. MIT 05-5294]